MQAEAYKRKKKPKARECLTPTASGWGKRLRANASVSLLTQEEAQPQEGALGWGERRRANASVSVSLLTQDEA